jgi:hypothetical protein
MSVYAVQKAASHPLGQGLAVVVGGAVGRGVATVGPGVAVKCGVGLSGPGDVLTALPPEHAPARATTATRAQAVGLNKDESIATRIRAANR